MITEHVTRQREWSERTFGPGLRTIGIVSHIGKELGEIRANPTDLEEWIDVMILAIDGYWRAGGEPDDLERHLAEKLQKNFMRIWPPIQPEDQPVEHVRTHNI